MPILETAREAFCAERWLSTVIPAKAGIQEFPILDGISAPVFTGVTFFRENDAPRRVRPALVGSKGSGSAVLDCKRLKCFARR